MGVRGLWNAIKARDLKRLPRHADAVTVNARNRDGFTPRHRPADPSVSELNMSLFRAIASKRLDRVKEVVEAGADVSWRRTRALAAPAETPIFAAAGIGQPAIVEYLAERGAPLDPGPALLKRARDMEIRQLLRRLGVDEG